MEEVSETWGTVHGEPGLHSKWLKIRSWNATSREVMLETDSVQSRHTQAIRCGFWLRPVIATCDPEEVGAPL